MTEHPHYPVSRQTSIPPDQQDIVMVITADGVFDVSVPADPNINVFDIPTRLIHCATQMQEGWHRPGGKVCDLDAEVHVAVGRSDQRCQCGAWRL